MIEVRHYLFMLLTMVLFACTPAWALREGDQAPTFTLKSLEGENISLEDYSGKVVAVSFWASWGKCEDGLKQLQSLSTEYATKGLVVIGINEREDRKKAVNFTAHYGLTFINLLDNGKTAAAYGVNGLPDLWILDRQGIVVARFVGYGPTVAPVIIKSIVAALSKPVPISPGPKSDTRKIPETIPKELEAYAHLQLGAAHLNIGDAYTKAGLSDDGHYALAVQEFREGLVQNARSVELHVWLGLVLERQGNTAGAMREYHAALSLDPVNIYAQDALRRLGVPWTPEAEEE